MISIVRATTEDIPALLATINKAYRSEDSRHGWTHELDLIEGEIRVDAAELQRIIQSDDELILTAQKNNRIIGTIHLRLEERGMYVGLFSVDPDKQGMGIGKLLLKSAEDYGIQMKASRLFMIVLSARTDLIAWYERCGYRKTGIEKPFVSQPKFGTPTRELFIIELEKLIPVG